MAGVVKTTINIAVAALVAGASFAGVFALFLHFSFNPLKEDIGEIRGEVSGLIDPMTGYQAAVRQGVDDAIERAILEDRTIKLEVSLEIQDKLVAALEKQNTNLEALRTDLVGVIVGQTKRLSADLGRIESELGNVKFRQNIMLQHILGKAPDDPEQYWRDQLKGGPEFKVAPLWVIKADDYSSVTDLADAYEWNIIPFGSGLPTPPPR